MLPATLYHALQAEIALHGRGEIVKAAAELSRRYRTGEPRLDGRFATTHDDTRAYAAYRMPATFEAVSAALGEVKIGIGEWEPHTLLDVGAGPGTATWAAVSLWPGIGTCTLVEREDEMISLGKRLAGYADSDPLRQATWLRADLAEMPLLPKADLVVAAYVLGELREEGVDALIDQLWERTTGVLVLVEPGTPTGFARILRLRERLLTAGARVVAPCPHGGPCPLAGGDWCHFGARVERSRLHRQLKEGELPYEDEKFSYVALSREPIKAVPGRVIRRPKAHKGHVQLHLCTVDGLREEVVTRKAKERYRKARKLRWGDAWWGEGEGDGGGALSERQ